MSTQVERMARVEVMREILSSIGGKAFWTGTIEGKKISDETFQLSRNLLLAEYHSTDAKLNEVQNKIDELKKRYEKIDKGNWTPFIFL